MKISLGSSSFQVACDIVQPIARMLPEDDLFSLVDRIEQALAEAINPPAFMNGAAAARYVRRQFDIPLTLKPGPPYRRLGPSTFLRGSTSTLGPNGGLHRRSQSSCRGGRTLWKTRRQSKRILQKRGAGGEWRPSWSQRRSYRARDRRSTQGTGRPCRAISAQRGEAQTCLYRH
jgi:hypothetical protein